MIQIVTTGDLKSLFCFNFLEIRKKLVNFIILVVLFYKLTPACVTPGNW